MQRSLFLLLQTQPAVTFSDGELNQLTERIQNAGTEVVNAKAGAVSVCICVCLHTCMYMHMHACTYECEHECHISLSVVCPFVCICMSVKITIKQLSLAIVNIGMQ